MSPSGPPSLAPGSLDAAEANVWRSIVEILLAQGDAISDAMRLADELVRQRRAHKSEKAALRRVRSGVRARVSSVPPAIPMQASKAPPSAVGGGATLRPRKG